MHSTLEIIKYGFKNDVRLSLRIRVFMITIIHDIMIFIIIPPMLLAELCQRKDLKYCEMIKKERLE